MTADIYGVSEKIQKTKVYNGNVYIMDMDVARIKISPFRSVMRLKDIMYSLYQK